MTNPNPLNSPAGILLVDKPVGWNAFKLVAILRRRLGVSKIGHTGTLDPFASGVMVMLVGRQYTRLSDTYLNADKEYVARLHLGVCTDSYDCDGVTTAESDVVPTHEQVEEAIAQFQGQIMQVPPMFSAKKVKGQKLYNLARKGIEIERDPVPVTVDTELIDYTYPHLDIRVACSKGTYIRSLANDLGALLGCGAHLSSLKRTRSGTFMLGDCIDGTLLEDDTFDVCSRLRVK